MSVNPETVNRDFMGQVTLTLNGRTYSVGCGDGEEERLRALGAHVRDKLETLVREFGQAGEARLFLLTALLVADELYEARAERDTAASTAAAAVLREIAGRNRLPHAEEPLPDPGLTQLSARHAAIVPSLPPDPVAAFEPVAEEPAPAPPLAAPKLEDASKPSISALQAAINRGSQAADGPRKSGAA